MVEHRDREHQHVHLVVSQVRSDGSLAREQLGDFHRAMDVCRQIEQEFGRPRLADADASRPTDGSDDALERLKAAREDLKRQTGQTTPDAIAPSAVARRDQVPAEFTQAIERPWTTAAEFKHVARLGAIER